MCPESIEQPNLKNLDSSHLVIAVSQPSFSWSPAFDKGDNRLASIGYKPVDFAANRGYLTRDNYNNYEFVSADHPSFDLRAAGSSAAQNVIELGAVDGRAAQRFVQTLGDGVRGGFQVVIADRETLKGQQFWFPTNCNQTTLSNQLSGLAAKLKEANSQGHALVFVTSLGDPGLTSGPSSSDVNSALGAVESAIGALGGSAQVFGRLVNTPNAKYGLVGASNLGQGQGQEASAAIAPGLADGRRAGSLTRGNDQEFNPPSTSAATPGRRTGSSHAARTAARTG